MISARLSLALSLGLLGLAALAVPPASKPKARPAPPKTSPKPLAVKPAAGKPVPKPAPLRADGAKSAAAIQAALVFPDAKSAPSAQWESAMVEQVASGKGRIDYEKGVARAIGLGALPPPSLTRSRAQDALDARDAALADALRTLSMSIQQVRVDARSRVSNYALKSDEVRVKVGAVVKNADVIEETFLRESGIFRVVVQVPLTGSGSIAEAVGALSPTPTITGGQRASQAPSPTPTPEPTPTPDPFAPGAPPPPGCEYTGLIVDCRGLGVLPSRAPKLKEFGGSEVYGTMEISPDFVDERGIVGYPRTMGDARREGGRAGSHPLIVRARRADRDRTCPLLSEKDARAILDANVRDHFLERTAVVFVVE